MRMDARIALSLVVVFAIALAISGCSSGSPPTAVPRDVTGTVKNLDTNAGVAGITVSIGGKAATGPTGTDGKFTVVGVLSPQTHAVTLTIPAAAKLAPAVSTMTVDVPAGTTTYDIGTIYVVPTAPDAPSGL